MKPQERDAEHDGRDGHAKSENEVRHDQAHDTDREQPALATPIGKRAGGIGCQGIHDVHHHHDRRHECDWQPCIL